MAKNQIQSNSSSYNEMIHESTKREKPDESIWQIRFLTYSNWHENSEFDQITSIA